MHSHNQTTGSEVIRFRSAVEWQQSTLLLSTELLTVLAMEGNIVKSISTYMYVSLSNQRKTTLWETMLPMRRLLEQLRQLLAPECLKRLV